MWTYCVCGEFRGIVIDIGDPDDSGGSVGQAIGGVSFHVRSLDDQSVLGDFLEIENKEGQQLERRTSNFFLDFYRSSPSHHPFFGGRGRWL